MFNIINIDTKDKPANYTEEKEIPFKFDSTEKGMVKQYETHSSVFKYGIDDDPVDQSEL